MEIVGKIIFDLGEQSGVSKAGNTWKKHEWVLETTDTQFPRKVKFTVFGENRLASIGKLEPNNSYALSFDLESREFNGRWYTDVNVYAARPVEGGNFGTAAAPESAFPPAPEARAGLPPMGAMPPMPDLGSNDNTDDLPF